VPPSTWYLLQEKNLAPKPVRLGPQSVAWPRQGLFVWREQQLVERENWQSLGDAASRVLDKLKP
jgi:predicted DNA-binding transcriptional regulator AlpA